MDLRCWSSSLTSLALPARDFGESCSNFAVFLTFRPVQSVEAGNSCSFPASLTFWPAQIICGSFSLASLSLSAKKMLKGYVRERKVD